MIKIIWWFMCPFLFGLSIPFSIAYLLFGYELCGFFGFIFGVIYSFCWFILEEKYNIL